jgi:hypothetical protein
MNQPETWGDYPEPHYDEDDICQCPDHLAMRIVRVQTYPGNWSKLRKFVEGDR